MKIDTKKINKDGKKFSLKFVNNDDEIIFSGNIIRISSDTFKMEADIIGSIVLTCDLSGEDFLDKINEKVYILFKNGLWKGNEQQKKEYDKYDVIEFFDDYIDMDYILYSELESIRLGYHKKHNFN